MHKHRIIGAALVSIALLSACGAETPTSAPTAASGAATATAGPTTDPGDVANLAGTSWTLTNLETAGTSGAPAGNKPITVNFDADGKLNGSSGCNSYFATYMLNAGQIAVSGVGGTKMACDNQAMDQETRFLDALSKVGSAKITGDQLVLSGGTGDIKLTFGKN